MQLSLILVCEVDIDASTWYQSWAFVAYQLLELCVKKVGFHGVIPFYLIRFHCMVRFRTQNTANNLRIDLQGPHQTWCYSCPLFTAVLQNCKSGSHKLDTLQTIQVCFPRIAPLLSLDSADVDIQLTQRNVQNNDKRQLVRLSKVFCGFSPSREPRKWPPI